MRVRGGKEGRGGASCIPSPIYYGRAHLAKYCTTRCLTSPNGYNTVRWKECSHKIQPLGSRALAEQEEELRHSAAKIEGLGEQVAAAAQQRTEERKGRTEAERRLRAEKQVYLL